jgi:phosphoribosylformylglycinamidine cyclo-ligase
MPGMYARRRLRPRRLRRRRRRTRHPSGRRTSPATPSLASPVAGVHSNGFSLVRRIVATTNAGWATPCPFGLAPRPGADGTHPHLRQIPPRAAPRRPARRPPPHITGGGLVGNMPRVLPDGTRAVIDASTWSLPVFAWLARHLATSNPTKRSALLNCGLGMVAVVLRPRCRPAPSSKPTTRPSLFEHRPHRSRHRRARRPRHPPPSGPPDGQ